MSLIKDTIKIKLSRLGYLPDYPYHLISDKEMCDAFIDTSKCSLKYEDGAIVENEVTWSDSRSLDRFFDRNYPCLSASEILSTAYQKLVDAICYNILCLKSSNSDNYELPDWVYTYMLGEVISVNADKRDIHDLLVMLGIDNMEDEFMSDAEAACYRVSMAWVSKLVSNKRPPTLFGEPHVIKSLRLDV